MYEDFQHEHRDRQLVRSNTYGYVLALLQHLLIDGIECHITSYLLNHLLPDKNLTMREFDYLAILFTQRIRGNEMAQDVTEAAFRLMKPDTHPNADEFRKLSFELCWHETTISPPLNIDHR